MSSHSFGHSSLIAVDLGLPSHLFIGYYLSVHKFLPIFWYTYNEYSPQGRCNSTSTRWNYCRKQPIHHTHSYNRTECWIDCRDSTAQRLLKFVVFLAKPRSGQGRIRTLIFGSELPTILTERQTTERHGERPPCKRGYGLAKTPVKEETRTLTEDAPKGYTAGRTEAAELMGRHRLQATA